MYYLSTVFFFLLKISWAEDVVLQQWEFESRFQFSLFLLVKVTCQVELPDLANKIQAINYIWISGKQHHIFSVHMSHATFGAYGYYKSTLSKVKLNWVSCILFAALHLLVKWFVVQCKTFLAQKLPTRKRSCFLVWKGWSWSGVSTPDGCVVWRRLKYSARHPVLIGCVHSLGRPGPCSYSVLGVETLALLSLLLCEVTCGSYLKLCGWY